MEGSPLGRTHCTRCGQVNPPGARFCAACGVELTIIATPGALAPPPELRERARAAAAEAAGRRRHATVLFADVAGSMELAERLDAEQWREVIDGLFKLLADAVHRHDGTVDKFTGDGIMALFGAPIADEDHARSACLAALEIRDEAPAYAARIDRDLGIRLRVRIGINSGTLVIGALGVSDDLQYTAIGHTVGLAQRMESLAPPDAILISESTAGLVRGYIELEDRGPVDVKGSTVPVGTFAPTGVGAARDRFDVARERGLTPLAGRSAEMAELEAALARAEEGEGGVVGIIGAAGVGKSRICHELVALCRDRGVAVYGTRCEPQGRDLPLLPVLRMMRGYFEIGDGEAPAAARTKVEERLLALDPSFEAELPLILDFLGVGDPADRPQMSAEARERRLNDLVRRMVLSRERLGPALALVEDLHWIDPASDRFLAALVAAASGTRTLVVVNMRPEYQADWMASSSYRQLPLREIRGSGLDELLRALLGADPSLDGLAALVGERTGGNPFFVEEVVRELDERGVLSGGRGDYRLAAEIDELVVPATVQAVLAARIDRLADPSRAALHAAAVIGPELTVEVLERVLGDAGPGVEEALRELVGAEFVRETSAHPRRRLSFVHPLTREVALETQLLAERQRLHVAAAAALEEVERDHLDESAATIAEHLEAGGRPLGAATWRVRAATWAERIGASAGLTQWEALAALDDELAVHEGEEADRLRLTWRLMVLSRSPLFGGDIDRLRHLYGEARAIAERREEAGVLANLHAAMGWCEATIAGRFPEYARAADLVLALEGRIADLGLRVSALAAITYADFFSGELESGIEKLERIIELTDADLDAGAGVGVVHPRAFAVSFRGWFFGYLGRFAEARAALEEGIEACERLDPESLIVTYICSGALAQLGERPPDATVMADAARAVDLAAEIGDVFLRVVALTWQASLLVTAGEPDRALGATTDGIGMLAGRGTGVEFEPPLRIAFARACAARDRIDEAAEAADWALRRVRDIGFNAFVPTASSVLAEVLVDRGDDESLARASVVIDQGVRTARRLGMRPMLIEALRVRAAASAAGGREEESRAALAEAIAIARAIDAAGALERLGAAPAVGP
ncbi:MAG: adenylate/guanylate cyclase domain-containing protein [Solirubrobacterales bacterium]